jgi:hypothetical protein
MTALRNSLRRRVAKLEAPRNSSVNRAEFGGGIITKKRFSGSKVTRDPHDPLPGSLSYQLNVSALGDTIGEMITI